ncbi:MAG: bifunctional indole-3-glycerol-phosphate synthase TrpC/phosphoribosylanthranilate isomerase TrpF [Synergistaceae bacterium]|nr:bifunctional indole-3-glycerol-phosphate synthase TrpC/phosphoribosylanthranilate isomerase TrpF [Synergistaceae bacterium]
MSTLDDIVSRKRTDVARRMERVSYETLLERAVPSNRCFGDALKKPGKRFILECKRSSPSEGLMKGDFDIAEIARVYKNFADAVSILTDEPFFQGRPEYIATAREILDVPILCKDFITGPYQVREARVWGADAVLLMLSVLNDETYKICALEAERFSMDALTEVHDETELERAIALGAGIIGINNRDLRTLKVDLDVFRRLSPRIPDGITTVCESGIDSREDIMSMGHRADAFLVGGRLMKADRLDIAVRRLIFGGVKICGLTSPEAAIKSYEAGASYGGLIFAPESQRRVDESRARDIAGASPLPMVGVFVNEGEDRISRAADELNLAAVQLHGEESREFSSSLRRKLPQGCEIWKAVPVGDEMPDARETGADRVLLDTSDHKTRGGTGRTFDWSLLEKIRDRSGMIIAGGIGPDNAYRASNMGCHAIDVNSGVEIPGSPGVKDGARLEMLFKNLRGA